MLRFSGLFVVAALVSGSASAYPLAPIEPPQADLAPPAPVAFDLKRLQLCKAVLSQDKRTYTRPTSVNQLAYDARYYDLDLHPDPATHTLTATVLIRATVVSGPLSQLDLDLDASAMTVDGVRAGNVPTSWTHTSDLLTVLLDHPYNTGQTVEVTVQCHGTSGNGAFGPPLRFMTYNGLPLVWTLSEPYGARTWWPCKDDPDDKADSVDVRVTLPSGMITASNGLQLESSDDGAKAFSHWRERYPIATYLVSIACYPYVVQTDTYVPASGGSMPILFFMFPDQVAPNATVQARVKDMIAAFAARFGEYPFVAEKYGHAEAITGGGMENQTCTTLGVFYEPTVAHELSHHWFGDAVTCRDFHHIWLNEGFAVFSSAVWAEVRLGWDGYRGTMSSLKYFGPGTVYVPDASNTDRMFSGDLTYDKGAWVVHMLRHVMGDGPFFTAIRAYVQQYKFSDAVTEDLQHVCESVSGRDLGAFFQEWIYGQYYPAYEVASSSLPAVGGGYDVVVGIRQTQAGQLFWMPVDVRITTATGAYTFVARDSTVFQQFTFHVADQPTNVELDPNEWILRTVASPTAVELAETPGLRLAVPQPNPMRDQVALAFWLPRAGSGSLRVLDAAGRRVAELTRGRFDPGDHRLTWDGRREDGHALNAGVYWVSLEFEGERQARRIAVVK